MTTPNPGAALAETITGLCARYRSELSYDPADLLEDIEDAVDTYRASQVEGERVRLGGWLYADGDHSTAVQLGPLEAVDEGLRPPDFYIEATPPPRTTPPVVEGTVCDG